MAAFVRQMRIIYIKSRSILLIAMAVTLIDQVSKEVVLNSLFGGRSNQIIPGLIDFKVVYNTGAAFSIFSDSAILLGSLSFLVSIGLIVWLLRHRFLPSWQALALAFLLGGAVGNGGGARAGSVSVKRLLR